MDTGVIDVVKQLMAALKGIGTQHCHLCWQSMFNIIVKFCLVCFGSDDLIIPDRIDSFLAMFKIDTSSFVWENHFMIEALHIANFCTNDHGLNERVGLQVTEGQAVFFPR